MLLDAGADPKAKSKHDGFGRTPIHVAAFNGNAGVVRMLLDAKADPQALQEVSIG